MRSEGLQRKVKLAPLFRCLMGMLFLSAGLWPAAAEAKDAGANRLTAVEVAAEDGKPLVRIRTEEAIGYRYTVYDSQSPRRIIVDFRGMEVSAVKESIPSSVAPIDGVKVSSFDLTSGKLGRVEILIAEDREYEVSLEEKLLVVALKGAAGGVSATPKSPEKAQAATPVTTEAAPAAKDETVSAPQAPVAAKAPTAVAPAKRAASGKATTVSSVDVGGNQAVFVANGVPTQIRYFTLTGPPRMVLDIYGVKPEFKERSFGAGDGFGKIRVGVYADKTRFVFDAVTAKVPDFSVAEQGESILVVWGTSAEVPTPAVSRPTGADVPGSVKAIDFYLENGKSVFAVTIDGRGEVIKPVVEGDVVRFGVKNVTISRRLRRVIDASAFPSAVRLITPYTVQQKVGQDVQFAAELKGPVPYEVRREGEKILFVVENGPFLEAAPASLELAEVRTPSASRRTAATVSEELENMPPGVQEIVLPEVSRDVAPAVQVAAPAKPVAKPTAQSRAPGYGGQRISLVFDNADIRNILQLIADVSQMNIIASDDVKGSLSLRLIDVPWDQALDIVLDINGLGKLQSDNVIRILPKDKIRELEKAEFTAEKTKRDLEPLVTKVMPISYSDLGNITDPIKEILSERGKLTPDARNKQIIVTDVPSVLSEVQRLVSILDTPERQVMIEARIVEADSSFSHDLGVNWGISYNDASAGANELGNASVGLGGAFLLPAPSTGSVTGQAGLASDLLFGRLGIDKTILDLRISALETSGRGKVISSPRVTTLNGEKAQIKQGTAIPYVTVSDSGTSTEFIDAVLSLEVTPVINPDGSVILDVKATNSSPGSTVSTGVGGSAPSIDTKEAKTKLLVKDGETTVIGGIFVENEDQGIAGVPILMHIPILGHLFKSTTKTRSRNELLIFITPRILKH